MLLLQQKWSVSMNRGSTLFLKLVVIIIGLAILSFCVFVLPPVIQAELAGDFDYAPILIGMYVPAIPFFIGLGQSMKLLNAIDANTAFSESSVRSLKSIKLCAFAISAFYTAGMPYIFYVADRDDAPGLAAIGFVIIFASFVVATAAAVFQKLFQNALEIQSENDLTV